MKSLCNSPAIILLSIFITTITALSCEDKQEEKTNEVELSSNISDYTIERQVIDPVLHDTAVYNFINQLDLFSGNSVLYRSISGRSFDAINLGSPTDISSNFSLYLEPDAFLFEQEDSLYVLQQIEASKDKIWDLQALHQAEIWAKYNEWSMNNHPFHWESFKQSGFGCFINLGLPIFNKKHDRAIIYIGYQCHYTLGSGSIFEYVRVKGKWQMNMSRNLWIS